MDEIRRNLADRAPRGDVVVVSHPSANTSRCQKFPLGNKRLRVGTMFSGIGAPETAWRDLGWDFRWCAEIEPFPSAVLAHRFPDVRNLGDVTKVDWDAVEPVDLLCFGSPCQSFSVAGKRLGLDDPRGNLALYALGVARRLRPRWLVFENVPGLLSSDGTGDFGAFLGLLGECGYGFAYRVLDAQHFGVPQRRRRVFVIGCLGDWTRAAAILFERESLSGHPPPRREAGEGVALCPTLRAGGNSTGGHRPPGTDVDTADSLIAFGGNNTAGPIDVATAVNAHGGPHGRLDFESERFIAFNLRGREGGAMPEMDEMASLRAASGGSSRSYVAQMAVRRPNPDTVTPALDKSETVAVMENQRGELRISQQTDAMATGGGKPGQGYPAALQGMAVRRLTPRECERLQGFPDDFTLVPYRGKPAADGNRYKALGNSMAVPVVRWLGERIAQADRT